MSLLPLATLVQLYLIFFLIGLFFWFPQRRQLHFLGPVFFHDLVRTGRRARYLWWRCLYACLLLAALCIVKNNSQPTPGRLNARPGIPSSLLSGSRPPPPPMFSNSFTRRSLFTSMRVDELARIADKFFTSFLGLQLIVILFVTPFHVAGAIAEEKERRTLEFLMATDLSDAEIVLGKLASRLANLFLLILTALPILSLMQFLGGIDPQQVIASFIVSVMSMLSLGCLSVVVSVYSRRVTDAILGTFFWALLLLLACSFFPGISIANPLLALQTHEEAGRMFGLDRQEVLLRITAQFVLCHSLFALACCSRAVYGLRAGALAIPRSEHKETKIIVDYRWRKRRPVGDFAMLWKELYAVPTFSRGRFGRVMAGGMLMLGLAGLLLAWLVVLETTGAKRVDWNSLVRILTDVLVGVQFLALAFTAATRVSREREEQTLDSLWTTQLNRNNILYPKWLGSIYTVRVFWCYLALIWLVGLSTGGLTNFALLWLVVACLAYTAFVACLGLFFSTVKRTSLQATLWTIGVFLALTFAPLAASTLFGDATITWSPSSEQTPQMILSVLSPLISINLIISPDMDFPPDPYFQSRRDEYIVLRFMEGIIGVVCFGVASVILWIRTNYLFRRDYDPTYRPERKKGTQLFY